MPEHPRSEKLSSNSLERIHILPNSRVKLRCNATGIISLKQQFSNNKNTVENNEQSTSNNNNDVQWYKDGKLIEQDSRRLKKWVSSYDNSNYMELELYALDAEDSGNYQCKRDKSILKNIYLNVSENSALSSTFNLNSVCIYFFIYIFNVIVAFMLG